MKRAALAILVLGLLVAPSGFADSVHNFAITQVQVSFTLNVVGDNMDFTFSGPHGNNVTGWGSVNCDFCAFYNTYAPGDSLDLSGDFVVEGMSQVKLGGITYNPETVTLFSSSLNGSTIIFPNGGSFSVTVPATFGPISGNGGQDSQFINFNLNTPPSGSLTVSFSWDADTGRYQFSSALYSATTVPEPATISFMVLGLSALAGMMKRKVL
jgi:hypothetical protein